MALERTYLELAILPFLVVFCHGNNYSNETHPKTFHIGYISGNRNKTTGKFDYYNLPGLTIR